MYMLLFRIDNVDVRARGQNKFHFSNNRKHNKNP